MHILQYFEIIIIIFKLKLRNTSPLYRSSLQGSLQKSVHRQISQNTDLVYKQIPILKPVQDGQNRKLTFSSVSWSRKKHPQETSPREVCCVMHQEGGAAACSKPAQAAPHGEAEELPEKQPSSDYPSSKDSVVRGPFDQGFGSDCT